MNFKAMPFVEFSAKLTGGQFVTAIAGTTHLSDPFLNEHFYRSSSPSHFWHLSGAKEPFDYEKKIDGLLNQSAFEFDFAKRKALASEAHGRRAAHSAVVEPQGHSGDFRSSGQCRGVYGQRLRSARVHSHHLQEVKQPDSVHCISS